VERERLETMWKSSLPTPSCGRGSLGEEFLVSIAEASRLPFSVFSSLLCLCSCSSPKGSTPTFLFSLRRPFVAVSNQRRFSSKPAVFQISQIYLGGDYKPLT
jgi:hypothetical protein